MASEGKQSLQAEGSAASTLQALCVAALVPLPGLLRVNFDLHVLVLVVPGAGRSSHPGHYDKLSIPAEDTLSFHSFQPVKSAGPMSDMLVSNVPAASLRQQQPW